MKKLAASALATALAMSISLPAFAADEAMMSSSSKVTSSSMAKNRDSKMKGEGNMMKKTTVDGTCMIAPVDTRDTALMAAFSTLAASMNAALSTRKDALKAAWALTDTTQRNAALKAAWETYGKAVKTARSTFKTSRQSAWSAFKTSAKACKQPSADVSGESTDGQL